MMFTFVNNRSYMLNNISEIGIKVTNNSVYYFPLNAKLVIILRLILNNINVYELFCQTSTLFNILKNIVWNVLFYN